MRHLDTAVCAAFRKCFPTFPSFCEARMDHAESPKTTNPAHVLVVCCLGMLWPSSFANLLGLHRHSSFCQSISLEHIMRIYAENIPSSSSSELHEHCCKSVSHAQRHNRPRSDMSETERTSSSSSNSPCRSCHQQVHVGKLKMPESYLSARTGNMGLLLSKVLTGMGTGPQGC